MQLETTEIFVTGAEIGSPLHRLLKEARDSGSLIIQGYRYDAAVTGSLIRVATPLKPSVLLEEQREPPRPRRVIDFKIELGGGRLETG